MNEIPAVGDVVKVSRGLLLNTDNRLIAYLADFPWQVGLDPDTPNGTYRKVRAETSHDVALWELLSLEN